MTARVALELVLWATAAVHATLGLFVLIYHRHLRTEPWDRSFGLFIFSMACATVGYAHVVGATELPAGLHGQTLATLGLAGCGFSFVDYEQRVTHEHRRWLKGVTRALFVAIGGAAALGWLQLPQPVPAPLWRVPGAPRLVLAATSWLGIAVVVVIAPLLVHSFERMHGDRSRGIIAKGGASVFVFAQAAMVHDLAVWAGYLQSYLVAPVAALACSVLMSSVILRRSIEDRRALLERRAALQHNYVELQRARDELVATRQLAALGELSAVIAHEVRNPLTVIKQAASGLRRRGPQARQAHLVRIVDEEAHRLSELVDDLLVYAKPLRLQRMPYDLCAEVGHLVSQVLVAEGRRGEVEYDLHLEGPVMRADGRLLALALRNVVRNAVQASPCGGTVSVVVEPARLHGAAAVKVAVRDQGPGMDASTRAKALDPFFTTRARGTGLGLAIVDRIVAAHAGTLSLLPVATGGLEVVLVLPRDTGDARDTDDALSRSA